MVGMEEGLLPHRRVIAEGHGVEEERRLCYVGVTRAQDTLTLSLSKSRTKWGKARPSIPSRFLLEMRGENERASQAAQAGQAAVERDLKAAAEAARAKAKGAASKAPRRPRADAGRARRPEAATARRPTAARS
jgi:ATP-dependent exoDNAse (exonuclease V) beta subunit